MFSASKTAAPSGGYTIQRSVRLRSSASAYFTRTPASAGNQKTFTFSFWVKRGTLSANQEMYFTNLGGGTFTQISWTTANGLTIASVDSSVASAELVTSAVYRDTSAWYHLVFAVDTTQATASNRVKVYVNGVQVTALNTATYPSLNYDFKLNNVTAQYIGRPSTGTLDGYLTEFNFIDGQALTPSSFGAYNSYGVWSPAKYTGTYGTNGFYLNFQDNSGATATTIGKDSSGNGNNWTPNNISVTAGATYDSMLDVPTLTSATNANFPVLNVIAGLGNGTYSDGNLGYLNGVGATWKSGVGSMGATSGKYYFEYTVTAVSSSSNFYLGVAGSTYTGFASYLGRTSDSWAFQWNGASSVKTNNDTSTTVSTAGSISVNDVIQIAIDLNTGSLWWGRNNTWVQGDPSAGTGASYTNLTGTILPGFAVYSNGGDKIAANFGQRPFSYTPPTGFNRLNTYNLATPTIPNGAAQMAATTYTGTGATLTVANTVNTVNFQPDFVWVKGRSGATDHALYDSVRGTTKDLVSNSTAAETTQATGLTAFGSTGFTVGTLAKMNTNAATYVGWQWKAGGTAVTNTSGSITSQVSANPSAGFSIVTYTGTGANATVGHGLGVAPKMIIVKGRSTVSNWPVYHVGQNATPQNGQIFLDVTNAYAVAATVWNNTAPTSSVFSLGTNTNANTVSQTYVAYCFADITGYSKFSSYTGNGSADGPFVYLGFIPRYVCVKRVDSTGGWTVLDTSRSPSNVEVNRLNPNASAAESTGFNVLDGLSNGFKIRDTDPSWNASGGTYIYMAFAENPFNYSLAR
jgi:hypothetical protein